MMPEALSKFIDDLLEGKDPALSEILRQHPVSREEFAALVRTAALTHGALAAIEVPEGAEAHSRARAVKLMESSGKFPKASSPAPVESREGLIETIKTLLLERFRKEQR